LKQDFRDLELLGYPWIIATHFWGRPSKTTHFCSELRFDVVSDGVFFSKKKHVVNPMSDPSNKRDVFWDNLEACIRSHGSRKARGSTRVEDTDLSLKHIEK
jgi:hypothetical protein